MTKPKPIGIWPGQPGGYRPVMADELKPSKAARGGTANVEKHGNQVFNPLAIGGPKLAPISRGRGTSPGLEQTAEDKETARYLAEGNRARGRAVR